MTTKITMSTARREFRPDIQGMRAIAVLAVVLYHAGLPYLPGGYVGVDIFFVISGFLITSHLVRSLEQHGRIQLADFYAKRVRRILPASVLVLVLTVLASIIWLPSQLFQDIWRGAVATAVYLPNVYFAIKGTDYLAETTPSVFQHYWSLGIEEQFYIVYPLLLLACWKIFKNKRSVLYVVLVCVTVSFLAGLYATSWNQPYAFFLLPFRAWELGVGGLVAIVLSRHASIVPRRYAGPVGWLGLAIMVTPIFAFSDGTVFPGYWAAIPTVGAALVILAGATRTAHGPGKLLSARPMIWVGGISYSLYLVHWPALTIPQIAVGYNYPLPLWVTLLIAVASVGAAAAIYRYVENPLRTARLWRDARPRRSLLSAVSLAVASAAIATLGYVYVEQRPSSDGREATHLTATFHPEGTTYVPSNMKPSLENVDRDLSPVSKDGCHRKPAETSLEGCIYGDADGERIVLFGDSHAGQWFPALLPFAEANGYTIESRTKSGCPSISATTVFNDSVYRLCDEWRDAVIDRINADPPALVVISNYGDLILQEKGDRGAIWGEALKKTIDRIDAPAVVIGDTPSVGETPALCLSQNLDNAQECAVDRDFALSSSTRKSERSAAVATGAGFIDLTDYMCNSSTCDPIIGDVLVYRDDNHMTATFSELLSPVLAEELSEVLDR